MLTAKHGLLRSDLTGVVDLRYTGGARMLLMLEVGGGRWRFKVHGRSASTLPGASCFGSLHEWMGVQIVRRSGVGRDMSCLRNWRFVFMISLWLASFTMTVAPAVGCFVHKSKLACTVFVWYTTGLGRCL
jgi:hypothetical protein